jgi:tRNA-Thr(GGU) m(6)t(6)A37 methyltransferase TsaA
MKFEIVPIGIARTPFKEKFAIPRQPGLAPSVECWIEFFSPYDSVDCFDGIESHSHLWVEFVFHHNLSRGWKSKVRPPRLGGNKKLGVFATRSSFRPNGLGLSVGRLLSVERRSGRVKLLMQGLDLLDGTPVIDIKPYLPYADCILQAESSFASEQPELIQVEFTDEAKTQCLKFSEKYPNLGQIILEILAQDPRPAYKTGLQTKRVYGVNLFDLEIKWTVSEGKTLVLTIEAKDILKTKTKAE